MCVQPRNDGVSTQKDQLHTRLGGCWPPTLPRLVLATDCAPPSTRGARPNRRGPAQTRRKFAKANKTLKGIEKIDLHRCRVVLLFFCQKKRRAAATNQGGEEMAMVWKKRRNSETRATSKLFILLGARPVRLLTPPKARGERIERLACPPVSIACLSSEPP